MAEPIPITHNELDPLVLTAKAVGDALRARILRVLSRDSFGVLELCQILGTAQPALSHHLKILLSADLVAKRREGNNLFYRRCLTHGDDPLTDLHASIFNALDQIPLEEEIEAQINAIHHRRTVSARAFFETNAAAFSDQQALICEPKVYANVIAEMINELSGPRVCALEVGPADGVMLNKLSETYAHVVGIDSANSMLDKTREALTNDNVRLVHKDFTSLPRVRKYNLLVAAMVLHHQPAPERFFQQAKWVIKPGGTMIVVELCPHNQDWVQEACGDLWLGFDADELVNWAQKAGFNTTQSLYLAQKNGFRIQIHAYQRSV